MIARRLLFVFAGLGLVAATGRAAPSDDKYFEDRVRPVFVEHCQGCHGPDKQKGGLRLDSRVALMKGGDLGPAVEPGDPDKSRLLAAIRHDGELKMPPTGKLKDRQIADLTAWVKAGAPWPDTMLATTQAPKPSAEHWAFRAVKATEPPALSPAYSVHNHPIDHFIFAKLLAKGLRPAPPADRRTLLRRVTFDLTGLPPTPEEIAAFEQSALRNPQSAFEEVVDRLLASSAYGERWGRHWLDVARYADSNGMDENLAYANAWRYRDWVIRAFNDDLPFDQFIREQLAGDLLSGNVVPTGFLTVGPKMLAEDDPMKMRMDIIDEQLDTAGQAFLGLTLGCARCHDHKFDPISTKDYYALAGIFRSTKTMDTFSVVAKWQERSLASATDQAKLTAHDAKCAELKRTVAKREAAAALVGGTVPELKNLRDDLAALEKARPDLPTAMAVADDEKPTNLRIHVRGSHLTLGADVPRGFPTVLTLPKQPSIPPTASGRRQLAEWITRPDHPLTARVAVNRIWTWHFGEGLVRTPDNFGRLGDTPVHAELLDWLAARFIREGWSVKAMHRLILTSATYQMAAIAERGLRIAEWKNPSLEDPDNRLRWRFNRQRLTAEAYRDALLVFGGTLDRTVGGNLLKVPNRQYVTSTANKSYDSFETTRRSVYLPVVRSALYEPFQALDFPDPSVPAGKRSVTTVPAQALLSMNGKLVREQTHRAAERLLARNELDDAGRVRWAYELAFARPATDAEVKRSLAFVARYEAGTQDRVKAWQALCRVLVATNEFVYVE